MKLVGDIKPHSSAEEAEAIRADCTFHRYTNRYGTKMLQVIHTPTGKRVESNTGDELGSLRLLAANLD